MATLNATMFELAKGYATQGMSAYVRLQEHEFAMESAGYSATRHQREVGADTIGFEHALRHALRQDPDVILVGELRGRETMKMALQLASFGILIFATVHTNSAPATIDRFVNAFPAGQQVKGIHRLFVRHADIFCPAGILQPGVLGPDTGIVQASRHRVSVRDLPGRVVHQVGSATMQDARPAGAESAIPGLPGGEVRIRP